MYVWIGQDQIDRLVNRAHVHGFLAGGVIANLAWLALYHWGFL